MFLTLQLILICLSLMGGVSSHGPDHDHTEDCRRAESLFYSLCSPDPVTLRKIQGAAGKRGAPGPKGDVGIGIQGPPGVVDYARVDSAMDRKLEEASSSQDEKIEQLEAKIAELEQKEDKLEELASWYHASNGYHYKLFKTAVNYAAAKAKCIEHGGILASVGPRDPEIRSELINLMKQWGTNVWIGANDIQADGRWVWEDGTIANGNDIDWIQSPKQPDGRTSEACAHMHPGFAWKVNDRACTITYAFLCEKLIE